MLINLSNHPISEWSEKQLKEASAQYGEVIDVSFPAIPPEATSDEIRQLALDIVNSFCSKYIDENFTVHIMGEHNFVYATVNKLRSLNIRCIASTSERKVSYQASGEKIVKFQFVKFREYK